MQAPLCRWTILISASPKHIWHKWSTCKCVRREAGSGCVSGWTFCVNQLRLYSWLRAEVGILLWLGTRNEGAMAPLVP